MNTAFFISIGVVAFMVLLIVAKIVLDTIRYNQAEKMREHLRIREITRHKIICAELARPIGQRELCHDCKLIKWFRTGIDGSVVPNTPVEQTVVSDRVNN